MNRSQAANVLSALRGKRVAVVGDLMLDCYIHGNASRISPEAPVPVVRLRERRTVLGGAANVLRNLAALGIRGQAFGIVGDDRHGRDALSLCEHEHIGTDHILVDHSRSTTIKTRVIADRQQVVRIDDESDEPVDARLQAQLAGQLVKAIEDEAVDAVIIEDYHKGVITAGLANAVVEAARQHGVITALDPHPGNPLPVKGLTLATPNRSEAFALTGTYPRPITQPVVEDELLLDVGAALTAMWQPDMLLITLGADGVVLFQDDQPIHHVPTVAREVFDVSGAGDTVIASFTGGLVAGLTPHEAIVFSNHAAGVVVAKVGTAPVDPELLLASFDMEP